MKDGRAKKGNIDVKTRRQGREKGEGEKQNFKVAEDRRNEPGPEVVGASAAATRLCLKVWMWGSSDFLTSLGEKRASSVNGWTRLWGSLNEKESQNRRNNLSMVGRDTLLVHHPADLGSGIWNLGFLRFSIWVDWGIVVVFLVPLTMEC